MTIELIIAFVSMAFGLDHEECVSFANRKMESLKVPPRDDAEIMRKRREAKAKGEHVAP